MIVIVIFITTTDSIILAFEIIPVLVLVLVLRMVPILILMMIMMITDTILIVMLCNISVSCEQCSHGSPDRLGRL